ncbi:hypothetical protein AMJ74_05900 [candidate division WOR_3 bacterium SM1_77]|uniref:Zinc-finger domain-containing protein n=1 Tax=candidate division WOR_3 bacterium SM1_77 TaxID=1703778 RepID=A0A0S8JVV0_UNCW3|nr:MAG: hypothetical protein AMJ74_05900 [candidate division WOR_3 bacterium SM1_77]
MKKCARYQQQMIDCIEDQLTKEAHDELLEHIERCAACAREYRQLRALYEVMDKDRVALPAGECFEKIKMASSQRVVLPKRITLKQLARILVPVLAVTVIFVMLFSRRNDVIEINIPVTNLIEDEEIAEIAFAGIVDEDIFDEIMDMEKYLTFDNDDEIEEMTIEEKNELIDSLCQRYALDT